MARRYQRGNQNPYIKEEQTTQWPEDTKGAIGIFWPLCCLFFFNIRILIAPLVSSGHCVVCSSLIYGFWLPLWYLLAIVLSVLLNTMARRYQRGNQNPYIKEGQTTQWPEDTKGVIRIRILKKDRQRIFKHFFSIKQLWSVVLDSIINVDIIIMHRIEPYQVWRYQRGHQKL
jgi:hypothetical protein